MTVCEECNQEKDDYYFTSCSDVCDYCYAMKGGN